MWSWRKSNESIYELKYFTGNYSTLIISNLEGYHMEHAEVLKGE